MRIEASVLRDYIKKITMNNEMMTFNLNFTEDGVTSSVKGTANVTMTLSKLHKEAFETYEAIGEIFIINSILISTMLNTFKDVVELERINEHTLKISEDKREVFIILADERVCDNVIRREKPELDFKISTKLTKTDFTPIIKDMSVLKQTRIFITNEDNKLTIRVGREDDSEHTTNIIETDVKEKIVTSIGEYIKYFYESVTDDFIVKIGEDIPLLFIEDTPLMTIETYIAPMVD